MAPYAVFALGADLVGVTGAAWLAGGLALVALRLVARSGWRRPGLLGLGLAGLPLIFTVARFEHVLATLAVAGVAAAVAVLPSLGAAAPTRA